MFKIPWYVHPHIHTGTCSQWCGTTGRCPCTPHVGDLTVSGGWWCGGPGRSPGWWGGKAETYRLRFCLSVHVLHPANDFLCFHSWIKFVVKKKVHEKKLRISVSKSHLYRFRLQYTTKIEKSAGLMRRNRHESTQLILCYVGNFFRGFPKHFRIDRRCQIMIILLQNYVRNI